VNNFISKLFFFKDAQKKKICHAWSLIIKVKGDLNGYINEGK
jgi:hypothetical protein